jgi:hypothetical protein
MNRMLPPLLSLFVLILGVATASPAAELPLPKTVEFNRDIRPILSDNCFACHGPDTNQRKANLRFDIEDGGAARVIVPGDPDKSEMLRRIKGQVEGKSRMPLPKFGKQLTPRQIDLIALWIKQGAKYQKHWSLIPPQRPELPAVADKNWPLNAIDRFVLARLEQEGLKPSPPADKRTLARRLAFDLIGLPPAPEQVEAFLADNSSQAYEKLVDQLLASPHYGERMALYWLDLVRYADTGGYHSDNHRDIALYRDYVITAFNQNKRFDVFTAENLAGDLLPNPTIEQKIASGYNRLLMTTEEGGAQPKEYTAKYQADRVRNASVVWLGLTMGCAECHSHKFDPVLTKEFYQFASFWADIQEKPVGRQDQTALPTPEQTAKLKELDEQMAAGQVQWEEGLRLPELRKLPKPVQDALLVEPAKRTDAQKQAVAAHARTVPPVAELQKQKDAINAQIPKTLISISGPPRTVRVLPRGNWLDDSGEIVQPAVPASLGTLSSTKDKRVGRLELARWLTGSENPLTARVMVNRFWKLFFGQGLVKTLDDFGSQGAWPTHPELLDYLAVEFRDSGWDVKRMIKQMVMSQTYRQSSAVSEELKQRDPYNALLARQARFRLDAEMVRDNALAVSGLLVPKIGGPSVKPYQPAGYWAMLNFPTREWVNDKGEGLYRRGLYTYWCRTFPHPSMVAFDAPSREECTVDRPRSNTPLQALVLLNDPTYVEASRALAEKVVRDGMTPAERLHIAFRQVLTRKPSPQEEALLLGLVEKHLKEYQADKKAAEALLQVGEKPMAKDLDVAELAAWTSVARVLLNLHETITRN